MQCLSYCIADKIDLTKLERLLRQHPNYYTEKYWQVVSIYHRTKNRYCFVFSNGTLVSWGLKRHEIHFYLDLIRPVCQNVFPKPLFDGFQYSKGENTTIYPHGYYNVDCLELESDDFDLKLSLSYGFSQSMKLKYYEERLDGLIERYNPYINQLLVQGKIRLSRPGIRRIVGEILAFKAELNLMGKFSYRPKYFWKYSNYEKEFSLIERYLDISERARALNHQINTLNEIFLMFNSYLEDTHAHKLEIVIIVLIAIEIVFGVIGLHM